MAAAVARMVKKLRMPFCILSSVDLSLVGALEHALEQRYSALLSWVPQGWDGDRRSNQVDRVPRTAPLLLPEHLECSVAIASETIDCKVVIEARSLRDAQSFHDGEARPIDDREVLIRESFPDGPSGLEVDRGSGLDPYRPASDAVPKAFGSLAMIAAVQEQPGFHDNVVGRDVLRDGFQYRFCAGVVPIPATTEANHTEESTKTLNASLPGLGTCAVACGPFCADSRPTRPPRSFCPCRGQYLSEALRR